MERRIFIHHGGALGDLLLSVPAINALRRPDDFIHLAGHCCAVGFLKEIGYVHEGSDVDSALFLPFFMSDDDRRTKDFLSGFDRIFIFTADRHSQFAKNARTIAHSEIIQTVPPKGIRVHVSDFRVSRINRSAVQNPGEAMLAVPFIHKRKAEDMLAAEGYNFKVPLIAVHPGSGGKKKRWPVLRYLELIDKIKENRESFFVIFSGPAEESWTRHKIETFVRKKKGVIHVCDEGLATVAALLSLCTCYAGNDSGISHLAAAVNGNVVALFGPTDPLLWKPRGRRVQVIFSESQDGSPLAITVEEVYAAIEASLFLI